ncbi:MAG: ferredoxin [Opitutales bacterium]|nr:ferredoxin [Opitutales bacterium]
MASYEDRFPDNAPGMFFVDENCIDCDLCRQDAPDFFDHNEDEGHTYVSRQPETEDEIAICEEAMESCPVDAIGKKE